MPKEIRDLGASVRARLLNFSKSSNQTFDLVLTRFILERLLYRLSLSPHADRFVLKGAMLLITWLKIPHRTTRDLDLLGFGEPDKEAMLAIFRQVIAEDANDGVQFDVAALQIDRIREELEYGGLRLRTTALVGGARVPITVDVGFGDPKPPRDDIDMTREIKAAAAALGTAIHDHFVIDRKSRGCRRRRSRARTAGDIFVEAPFRTSP